MNKEIAKDLLKKGLLSIEQIANETNLSIEELMQIKEELKKEVESIQKENMAENIKNTAFFVTDFVCTYMTDEFRSKWINGEKVNATFKTSKDTNIIFTAYKKKRENFVIVHVIKNYENKKYNLVYESSTNQYGHGYFASEKQGFTFTEVGNKEKKPGFQEFKTLLGKKIEQKDFAIFRQIEPILLELIQEIHTLQPVDFEIYEEKERKENVQIKKMPLEFSYSKKEEDDIEEQEAQKERLEQVRNSLLQATTNLIICQTDALESSHGLK